MCETGEIIQNRIEYWQNKYYETQQELNNLKEIEQSHQEENGKLRVEFEKVYEDNLTLANELEKEKAKTPETIRKQFEVYQNKIQALEKQHEYDMQMIDEVKRQAVEWANELEQEKEKNKELEKHQKQYLDGEIITAKQGKFFEKMIKGNYVRKDKLKEKIEDYEKMIEGTFKDNTWYGQNRRDNCYEIIRNLNELLEDK